MYILCRTFDVNFIYGEKRMTQVHVWNFAALCAMFCQAESVYFVNPKMMRCVASLDVARYCREKHSLFEKLGHYNTANFTLYSD